MLPLRWICQYQHKMKGFKSNTHPYNKKIKQPIYAGALKLGLSGVLHKFGVLPREDDDAIAPRRVAQHAAPQQDLVVVQREVLFTPAQRPYKQKIYVSYYSIASELRGRTVIILGYHAEIPSSIPGPRVIFEQPTFVSLEILGVVCVCVSMPPAIQGFHNAGAIP